VRPVYLIAANFVREQRWPILLLLICVLGLAAIGAFLNLQNSRDDVILLFKQLAVYGIAFSVFFGASAIHNERKSRRILAVLSKAITRRQYIAGLLSGIAFAATLYCFAMGMTGTWVLGQIGFQPGRLWFFMMALLAACLLGAAIAVFFSVLLNPLLATAATAALVAIPFALAQLLGPSWGYTVPVYSLVQAFLTFSINQEPIIGWSVVLLGFAEAIIAWLAASWLFEWKDVAVAIE
jgi:ABC-type transport system involved in multi-copper enzyme maturation permease subunit